MNKPKLLDFPFIAPKYKLPSRWINTKERNPGHLFSNHIDIRYTDICG